GKNSCFTQFQLPPQIKSHTSVGAAEQLEGVTSFAKTVKAGSQNIHSAGDLIIVFLIRAVPEAQVIILRLQSGLSQQQFDPAGQDEFIAQQFTPHSHGYFPVMGSIKVPAAELEYAPQWNIYP